MTTPTPDNNDLTPPIQPQEAAPPPPPAAPTEYGADKGTLILVLSIVGLLCCGPLALVAFIMGTTQKNEADAAGLPLNSSVNAGRIIGLIAIVLWVLGVIVRFAFLNN